RTSGDERRRILSSSESGATGSLGGASPDLSSGVATGSRRTSTWVRGGDWPAPASLGGAPFERGASVAGGAAGEVFVEDVAPSEGPMTATTLFTGTVSPSLARISVTTPAIGEGISASTLS